MLHNAFVFQCDFRLKCNFKCPQLDHFGSARNGNKVTD